MLTYLILVPNVRTKCMLKQRARTAVYEGQDNAGKIVIRLKLVRPNIRLLE